MSKLYTEWASLYDELYAQLFDYTAEYMYYSRFLDRFGCWSVLEYGCGTGRLATHLVQAGYDYMGVDVSPEMIALARARNSGVCFTVGDLATFRVGEPVDAALITASLPIIHLCEKGLSATMIIQVIYKKCLRVEDQQL